ncbi:hypothetical protein U3516DRAFT_857744 [Neocallimastix sp. 'constans']
MILYIALTTSNNNGNNPVSLFTGTSNENVFIISDLRQNKRLSLYIKNNNLGRNTDINNYYNPFSTSSHHNIEYSSRSDLFKAIAAQYIKDRSTCKDLYFYRGRDFRDDYSEISCYIVTNNDVSYSVDTSFSPNTLTYRQIENRLGGYHKTYFTNRIRDPAIGIIYHKNIILKVLEERVNKKQISLERIEKISNLAKMLAILKMIFINWNNNFNDEDFNIDSDDDDNENENN